jgi:arylsulfatase A-like enzyme
MFVGFPNPHIPFDAPEPYASMYDPASVLIPDTFYQDLEHKPPQHLGHKRYARKENFEELDEERLRRVIALYYGSVTLVDDQVGKVLEALEERSLADNTLVVFMSDHGELLGHYGMLIKSVDKYPLLYDVGLKVPLVVRAPDAPPGITVNDPVELVDIAPTVLEYAGLEAAPYFQGRTMHPAVYRKRWEPKEYVFAESGAVKMLRDKEYKLVYYPEQEYGELYKIDDDPDETDNLFDDADYAEARTRLLGALLNRLIAMEGPRHGECKKGPAYWRALYTLPFKGHQR